MQLPYLEESRIVALTAALQRASVASEKLLNRYVELDENLQRRNANGKV